MNTVVMTDGTEYTVRKLLTADNVKLDKSNTKSTKYLTYGMSLAPHTMSGYNVCSQSTPGCRASCIVTSGFGGRYASVNRGRVARTRLLFQNRAGFKAMLFGEMRALVRKAEKMGRKLAIRLNVFSDIPWERVFPELFTEFSAVQFYDYTKRTDRDPPANYHLTFSRSETNEAECRRVLAAGGTVAAVFGINPANWPTQRPAALFGAPIVNGDETDLRFLDPPGSVVGLYAKGSGRSDKTGFVIPLGMVNALQV